MIFKPPYLWCFVAAVRGIQDTIIPVYFFLLRCIEFRAAAHPEFDMRGKMGRKIKGNVKNKRNCSPPTSQNVFSNRSSLLSKYQRAFFGDTLESSPRGWQPLLIATIISRSILECSHKERGFPGKSNKEDSCKITGTN